ncbi:MAG TPA: cyclase family protein [Pirellulaceae bacterium]|nr:cyclase family protein [Pirellulaceae bacterium]
MPQYFLESPSERYEILFEQARSIAIRLDFEGDQPNHYGAPRAQREPLNLGEFVGDTQQKGSCNVDTITLVPHCNGTHTETVGHIVHDRVAVADIAPLRLLPSLLVSVPMEVAHQTTDTYRPPLNENDRVITATALKTAIQRNLVKSPVAVKALIVRTAPNDTAKISAKYGIDRQPPFFTRQAMQLIVESGIEHLLVDFPSIDRMFDEGLLSNHHLFWNVADGSRRVSESTRVEATITEMVFVVDELADGFYLLDLHVAPFCSDAAPSRPALIPLQQVEAD